MALGVSRVLLSAMWLVLAGILCDETDHKLMLAKSPHRVTRPEGCRVPQACSQGGRSLGTAALVAGV